MNECVDQTALSVSPHANGMIAAVIGPIQIKRRALLILVACLLAGCSAATPAVAPATTAPASPAPTSATSVNLTPTLGPTATPATTPTLTPVVLPSPTAAPNTPVVWDVYDQDPQHLWNRLFHSLYGRTAAGGQEYGRDELDPLLWQETTYLIKGPSHTLALATLDEFLATNGDQLISDPVRRAMLQRDLWAVFDWLTLQPSGDLAPRRELEQRLAQAIKRLALSRQQIDALPDSYAAAIGSGAFPVKYQADSPQIAFLPIDMFRPDGDWICLGREGGPIAMTHLANLPFLGRSAFLVFLRAPGGREYSLAYLRLLQQRPSQPPLPPAGTEVALVRRMLLIDSQGEIVASPLIESVQLRHFYQGVGQIFFELVLNRDHLFAGDSGGLRPIAPGDRDFVLFLPIGDPIGSPDAASLHDPILTRCSICHEEQAQGIYGANSILSYSRARFPLPGEQPPTLVTTTPDQESRATIEWKMEQASWQQLLAMWR